tara:strand:- start:112 stop:306 length:195 start_codon:yes stop_codon:yes gene_type:complete
LLSPFDGRVRWGSDTPDEDEKAAKELVCCPVYERRGILPDVPVSRRTIYRSKRVRAVWDGSAKN